MRNPAWDPIWSHGFIPGFHEKLVKLALAQSVWCGWVGTCLISWIIELHAFENNFMKTFCMLLSLLARPHFIASNYLCLAWLIPSCGWTAGWLAGFRCIFEIVSTLWDALYEDGTWLPSSVWSGGRGGRLPVLLAWSGGAVLSGIQLGVASSLIHTNAILGWLLFVVCGGAALPSYFGGDFEAGEGFS